MKFLGYFELPIRCRVLVSLLRQAKQAGNLFTIAAKKDEDFQISYEFQIHMKLVTFLSPLNSLYVSP